MASIDNYGYREPTWLGHSKKEKSKNTDWFKTNTKNIPFNMFKDSDKDGVSDGFDCQPHNKNKQGFVDALIGGVKGAFTKGGSAKQGWKEGMAKSTWREQAYRQRTGRTSQRVIKARNEMERERIGYVHDDKERKKQFNKQVNYERVERIMAKKVAREYVPTQIERLNQRISNTAANMQNTLQRQHPNFEIQQRKIYLQNRMADKTLTSQQRRKASMSFAKAQAVLDTRKMKFRDRAVQMAYPVTSMTSYGSGGAYKTIQGVAGRGRGRPRGSLDKRYAQYGGVFGYRRFISDQKRALRAQLQKQQEGMAMQRIKQQPQYEQQQYQEQVQASQVPQELQGQGMTPEYAAYLQSQQQQVPQQVPQQVQQFQQQEQQPFQQYTQQASQPVQGEIKTVFKSSGGTPYTIPKTGLRPTRETIPYGYVETVDAFTGQRMMKPLPRKEKWSGGSPY